MPGPESQLATPLPSVLIALPKGAMLSGITTWAATLARGLSGLGHRVMLLVHTTPDAPGEGTLAGLRGCPGVEVRLLERMPPIDAEVPGADDRPEAPAYVQSLRDLNEGGTRAVVAIPTYSAECFGLLAAASRVPGVGEHLRTIGWMHNDIAYDRLTLSHYRDLVHRFVGVSSEMVGRLRGVLRERGRDVEMVPYGVPIPDPALTTDIGEDAASRRPSGGTLRLVYTGRMDIEQKRVMALTQMSGVLERKGIDHELVLVGDGPAAAMVDAKIAGSHRIRRVTAKGPEGVSRWLAWADVFVLASRYEGLSVSMLEAMAHGCVPVVTRVSGAMDAVGEGADARGVIVDAGASVDDPELPERMADGVRRAADLGIKRLGAAARCWAEACFSERAMALAVSSLCRAVAAEPPRQWPEGVPTKAGDFTVPADAAAKTSHVLLSMPGHRIGLWGAGRHTRAVLRGLRSDAPALRDVVCVCDDAGGDGTTRCGAWPVVGPAGLAPLGVTDIVISSALHEDALWERRGELERLGIRVHRVYG